MDIRQLCDDDFQFLEEIAQVADARLAALMDDLDNAEGGMDPGVFLDRAEQLVGLGLIACQTYLTEVIGEGDRVYRERMRGLGPKHPCGHSVADVVNAGANYAKHSPEGPPNPGTTKVLAACGVLPASRAAEYLLTNILHELVKPAPARFENLLPALIQWRDAVIGEDGSP